VTRPRVEPGGRLRAALLGLLALAAAGAAGAGELLPGRWVETPALVDAVSAGDLPPIEQRLPRPPSVATFGRDGQVVGRHGGALNLLFGRARDIRIMVVYGYARLVAWNRDFELVPDILESVDVEGGRRFTLRLRAGHRWSDGHPFTSEDFRFWWEDIATHPDLSPFGPPAPLVVAEERPRFTVLDERTVRYEWSRPNPFFLPALAGARPEHVYAPAHDLRSFHARYADEVALDAAARAQGQRNWVAVHSNLFRPYRNENPDLPTLDPWVNTNPMPSQRFVLERNPYFHRVDPEGRQLPYVDRVFVTIADGRLIPAKAGAGEADLQARHLNFRDYTFLKASERRTENRVRLWEVTKGAQIALYPNLNAADPEWRGLLRDARFRRALSLAVNRREINQVIYYGLAREGADTVYPGSELFRPEYETAWSRFDPAAANALLDELGLVRRDARGIRLLPSGRPLEIVVETAGEDTEETDVLQLIVDTWRDVGIRLLSKPIQREVFRRRVSAGQTLMGVWGGLENGLATPDMPPEELAPTNSVQLQWPRWGQFHESSGSAGEPPDLPPARELVRLNEAWLRAEDRDERARVWHEMLAIRAEEVYSIGIVRGVPQPVVVNRRLRNVPEKGVFNWEPGAHFGIYRPDTFWFEDAP
jgi:peptide/nickel transport system substrate-binding protein